MTGDCSVRNHERDFIRTKTAAEQRLSGVPASRALIEIKSGQWRPRILRSENNARHVTLMEPPVHSAILLVEQKHSSSHIPFECSQRVPDVGPFRALERPHFE